MENLYVVALLGSAIAGAAGALGLFPSDKPAAELRGRSATRADVAALESPILRLLWPLLVLLAPYARRLGSEDYLRQRTRDIPLAGLPLIVQADHFLALKVVMAVGVPIVLAIGFEAFRSPVLFLASGAAAFLLPDQILKEQKRAREEKIVRALPGAVDMLTLSVEAGMDFQAALQRVVEKGPGGPLREEITTILNDIRLGQPRGRALKSFADRIDSPEIAAFVGVLVQADRLGASIGPILRTQADRMRVERFQRAEKMGARASQKILLPLAIFIFPAVLLIMISPAVLTFIYEGVF